MRHTLTLALLAGLLAARACVSAAPVSAADTQIVFRCTTEKAEFLVIAKIREWAIHAGYANQLSVVSADSRSPERGPVLYRNKDGKIDILVSPSSVFSGILSVYFSTKKEDDEAELKKELARFLTAFPEASTEKIGQPASTANGYNASSFGTIVGAVG